MAEDESIVGLLLRAYRKASAQAHGEQFVHNNIPAMCGYENAMQSIEHALKSVMAAERQVGVHETRMAIEKEQKRG